MEDVFYVQLLDLCILQEAASVAITCFEAVEVQQLERLCSTHLQMMNPKCMSALFIFFSQKGRFARLG